MTRRMAIRQSDHERRERWALIAQGVLEATRLSTPEQIRRNTMTDKDRLVARLNERIAIHAAATDRAAALDKPIVAAVSRPVQGGHTPAGDPLRPRGGRPGQAKRPVAAH